MTAGSEDVTFKALADPTRRALLDALFGTDGQTVSALCRLFPDMSRFGVMKHLKVLEEGGLVTTVRTGRTKLHFLNPVPISQIAHRWISKYAEPFSNALVDLERQVRLDARDQPNDPHQDTPQEFP